MVLQQNEHKQIGRNRGPASWNLSDFLKNIGSTQKSQKINITKNDNGMFPKNGEDVLNEHKNNTLSDLLTTVPHPVSPKFVEITGKHPIFCGNLRVG